LRGGVKKTGNFYRDDREVPLGRGSRRVSAREDGGSATLSNNPQLK